MCQRNHGDPGNYREPNGGGENAGEDPLP
ncbi:unnamed protein product [Spirodela intermedia]|uniref:Uncharacterized protein n=2 Tax=Spirodela intermedia TaxID=51605 RepID=A0A7I8JMC2_SPIIN|nr:unnamed protein product [Spirodela intermedia]CAA6671284.1 unnamed protein product [Spirodela intermedia]CAA7408376.1 unnamed protein product [Spirodela intermedia]